MTFQPSGESYGRAALDRECEDLARTSHGRNDRLNRAAFAMGQLVGAGVLGRGEVERRLLAACTANGYIAKDGDHAAQATIRSGLDRGMREPRTDIPGLTNPRRTSTGRIQPRPAPSLQEVPLPDWTPPGDDGRPLFTAIGKAEPEPVKGEIRRHIYRRDGEAVRVKVKRGTRNWLNLYRVRRPSDGATGWQAKRPDGFLPVPYTGPASALDPFDVEHLDEPLFWPEGERDTDTLQRHGCMAFTFGGSSDVPDHAEELVSGRDLIIVGDHDEPGRKCVERKIELALRSGASVRVIHFPDLQEGGDVSDWFARPGSSVDALMALAIPATTPEPDGQARSIKTVTADVLYGLPVPDRLWHVQDRIPACTVTLLGGDGATGKSLLALQLAASTALSRPWIGHEVRGGKVLYLSAEDDLEELHRRLADIARAYGTSLKDLAGLKLVPLAGEDAVLAAPAARSNLISPTELWSAVEKEVADWKPTLVVLDTLADLFAGDENSRAQARQFVGLLRGMALRHDTTVLLLAHPSLSGISSGSGSSGSTAWNNSVRSRLYLERIVIPGEGNSNVEPDPDLRRVKTMKANYSAVGGQTLIRWRDGVFWQEEGEQTDALEQASRAVLADATFLHLVAQYEAEGRQVSATPSANYAPVIFAKDPRSKGLGRTALQLAMNRLFHSGRITTATYGPPSKSRKCIVLARATAGD